MDMKEKLVEFLSVNTCPNAICNFCEHFQNKSACEKHKKEVVAENMIENGVTVQERGEWIKNGWNDYSCSVCECQLVGHGASHWKYCPHCGAKMMPPPPKGE